MTHALYYSSVKTPSAANQIFGIQVATLDWLRAYFRYSAQQKFNLLVLDKTSLDEATEVAAEAGVDTSHLVAYDARYAHENFRQFDTVIRIDPDPRHILWQRQSAPGLNFTFCGLAHAIAGWECGDLLEKYCLGPSEETDAIICPSHAVKDAIRSFWDIYGEYIERRFGKKFTCPVQLPVIPLGVNTERFAKIVTPEKRAQQRQALGLNDTDFALLWVGRLSHAIKAHPLAMFRAAEMAVKKTGKPLHFFLVGYFMPVEAEAEFRKLAAEFCPTAKITFVASDDARFPDGLWAGADAFISLVENVQESFGLTPIEAIAAGLPRIVSDWDGYRDSVTHGVDGFLIPTVQPPAGAGREIATQLLASREFYSGFLCKTALSTAVDHYAAADAIVALMENPNLRREMANKARARLPHYEWRNIIPAYEKLWQEMATKRQQRASTDAPWPAVPPQVPDPYAMYKSYPSTILQMQDTLQLVAGKDEIMRLWSYGINNFGFDLYVAPDDMTALLNWLSSKKQSKIADVFAAFPSFDQARLWRSLGWLIKLGIVKLN